MLRRYCRRSLKRTSPDVQLPTVIGRVGAARLSQLSERRLCVCCENTTVCEQEREPALSLARRHDLLIVRRCRREQTKTN